MKKLSLVALVSVLALASCKESKADQATTGEAQSVAAHAEDIYTVAADSSKVNWTAYHAGGLNPRFGTTETTGTLSVQDGELISGNLVSDMGTLTTDPKAVDSSISDGKTSVDLDNHLKSADFFDIEKNPTVTFDITKVEALPAETVSKVEGANKLVSGNLTIKGKTVNVSFPAKVDVSDSTVSLTSKFTINRQDWGLTYGTEGDPKDWMISQEVDLDLNLVATK
ncbi:YceI family protein [Chryseobacterium sp. A321]